MLRMQIKVIFTSFQCIFASLICIGNPAPFFSPKMILKSAQRLLKVNNLNAIKAQYIPYQI